MKKKGSTVSNVQAQIKGERCRLRWMHAGKWSKAPAVAWWLISEILHLQKQHTRAAHTVNHEKPQKPSTTVFTCEWECVSGGFSSTRRHCGSVSPPPSDSPALCCSWRIAVIPDSGEAEDLRTVEVVVVEMEGRSPGCASWCTRCFPCPNLCPPASPWPGTNVALPSPCAVFVFLCGQRFWMCDTASSATMPSPAVTCSEAWTVNSWVSSAHRSDTRHSYTPSSSFFTLDRLRRCEIAFPWTRTVCNTQSAHEHGFNHGEVTRPSISYSADQLIRSWVSLITKKSLFFTAKISYLPIFKAKVWENLYILNKWPMSNLTWHEKRFTAQMRFCGLKINNSNTVFLKGNEKYSLVSIDLG